MDSRSGRSAADRLWLGYLVAGVLVILAYYLAIDEHAPPILAVACYLAVSVSAAVMVFVGCVRNHPRPRLRLPWTLLGAGQATYAAGDAYFYLAHDLFGSDEFPSVADPLYLAHYPLVVAGLVLLIRLRAPARDLPGLLDAAALAVVAAMLSWLYLIGPLAHIDAPLGVRLVSCAYPVLDLALLVFSLRLILAPSARPASFVLLSISLLAILLADSVYVIQQLVGDYASGNFLDGVWLAGNLTLGAAALHPTMGRLDEPRRERDVRIGPARLAVLTTAALIAPATLVLQDAFHALQDIPIIAAVCAALCIFTIARLAGLLIDQRRLVITDPLTGLRTRRYFAAQLPTALARARRAGAELSVLVIDIDHFKSVNDRYGHPAGDRALREIARRLRACLGRGDLLARYGGEEFVVVAPGVGPLAVERLGERLREAVADAPIVVLPEVWIAITVSVGAAGFPLHGATATELLVAADRALYAAKAQGRDRVVVGERDRVPLGAPMPGPDGLLGYLRQLAEDVDAGHGVPGRSRQVGRWAGRLATELGLPESSVRCAELAGELRDVGKALVPQSIWAKPEALSTAERAHAQAHADHGYQLIRVVPGLLDVAQAVRQHHEHWDGHGYPDGLAGAEIRIEARIVAVCDAWAVLTADRPHRRAHAVRGAGAELLRGRAERFDPAVLDAFLLLRQREALGEPDPLRAADSR